MDQEKEREERWCSPPPAHMACLGLWFWAPVDEVFSGATRALTCLSWPNPSEP